MQIDQFLEKDDVSILTPTERVARDLRGRRAALKRSSGYRQWDDPGFIGTLRRYCSDQWDTLFDGRQLLHSEQLLTLCKQSIDASGSADGVISSMSMARKMRQAERLIREYSIEVSREGYIFGLELSAFYSWHKLLSERLERSDYITEYDLPSVLTDALINGSWTPDTALVLYGFLELTPSETDLLAALRAQGAEVHVLDAKPARSSSFFHVAHSPEEELADAAHWLSHQIKSVPKGQKAPRCALIVPNLDRHRMLIRQILDRELAPNSLRAGVTPFEVENVPWYAFAGGEYLAELPWIRSVMDLLSLRADANNIEDLSRLLLGFSSPMDHGLHFEGAKLDLKLRERHSWKVSGKAFVEHLSRARHIAFRRLSVTVERFLKGAETFMLPSQWADRFESLIREAGYLDSDRLLRVELHQWQSFQDALDVLRSLDAQMGELPYAPVYRWLDEICHTRRYSHDQSTHAPVQVLAPEEAYGLCFDRAWVLAVESRNFPEPVEPNPFLPVNAQSDAGVPSASSVLNTERSQKLIDHVARCARGVVLSMHSQSQGAPCISSGLIDWDSIPALDMDSFQRGSAGNRVKLVSTRKPDKFPQVSPGEKERLTSGVSIFADFAQDELCASLVHRLHIKPFPTVDAGLTGSVQGNLVHDALHLFWSEVRTSETLHSLSSDQLQQKVRTSVTQAMADSWEVSELRYGANLLTLERFRISDLVISWLEFEKERVEPFEVIVSEGTSVSEIEGLRFKVRIDRIDRVFCEDGAERHVIIDYKTGRIVDMRALNSDRLKAPQLPIYATFTDLEKFGIESADGVSLAKVYSGDITMHVRSNWSESFTESAGVADKRSVYEQQWLGQLEAWRNRLIDNATAFLSGQARLSYRPHEYLGSHAHLQPLMRLGEG